MRSGCDGKARFIRTKVELGRAAIIKHFGEPDVASTLGRAGVSVVQVDEFFIDTQLDEAAARTKLMATAEP